MRVGDVSCILNRWRNQWIRPCGIGFQPTKSHAHRLEAYATLVVFRQSLTLFVISLTMTEETAIETILAPASNLARKKILQRRLFVVIASAILTLGACAFLGMQFGSAEQVILTLLSLAVIALLLRVFRSKGRFRFASLLLLTAFSAIVFRVVLQPLIRRSDQNAAIELINRKGGSVSTYSSGDEYPLNASGWVLTKSGYLYPALLQHLDNKFLNPVDVYGLVIPSSLANQKIWESLQVTRLSQIEVLLDGADNAIEFREALDAHPNFFVSMDDYYYRPLVYVANELRENDIRFLNGMASNRYGTKLPVIRLGLECRFEPTVLDGLNNGFELVLEGMEIDPNFLRRVLKLEKLKRVSINRGSISKKALMAISEREQPLDSLCIYSANFDAESWDVVCNMSGCRSLRLSDMEFQGQLMPAEVLQQLGQNKSIQELIINLRGNRRAAASIISLVQIDGLKRLELHCDAPCKAEMIAAIEPSTLEDVWLDMDLGTAEAITKEPWMDRLKSLRIGNQQIVAPKSE